MADAEDRIPEPVEAKKYLARKKIVETENWDDLKHGEHSHAFTVAHSRNAGILNDIFGLLNKALEDGESFASFKKNMRSLMEDKGWYGKEGKTAKDEEYINWRISLIYHVNMRTAYSAGRYRNQMRGAAMRPILKYHSMMVGTNRREEHKALHGKAFRYDDPFWDANYPPNGWGCECTVTSLSEKEAEDAGVKVLHSDANGNPPPIRDANGKPVNWDTFAPEEWRYNPGREALAPNFRKYESLAQYKMEDGRTALAHVTEQYRRDMDGTRLTQGEFDILIRRMSDKDYNPNKKDNCEINYQVGNIDQARHKAMTKHGIDDSKIMATDRALYHSTGDKNNKQKLTPKELKEVYSLLQTPERIYEEKGKEKESDDSQNTNKWRVFHFVKDTGDGNVIKILVRQEGKGNALKVITMASIGRSEYVSGKHKQIWPPPGGI